jgi:uncharacterized protein YndB with AHSA1/START domain
MTEPKPAEEPKKERRLEREVEISAPIEGVWKALADATELARWFPLESFEKTWERRLQEIFQN